MAEAPNEPGEPGTAALRRLVDSRTGQALDVVYALPVGMGEVATPEGIPLVQLLGHLWRAKWVIGLFTLTVGALAAVYAWNQPRVYRLNTVVEIGRTGAGQQVEAPEDLRQKLDNAYRLQVLTQALAEKPEEVDVLRAWNPQVTVPKGAALLLIQLDVNEDQIDRQRTLLEQLIVLAAADHERILDLQRQQIRSEIDAHRRKLEALADERTLQKGNLSALDLESKLVDREIQEIIMRLDKATQDRERAVQLIDGQAQALTLLMIENGVQADRKRLADYQSRQQIGIPSDRANLEKTLADLDRRSDDVRQDMRVLEQRLRDFLSTRAVVPPTMDPDPVGPRRSLVVLAAMMLGCVAMCGVVLLRGQLRHALTKPA